MIDVIAAGHLCVDIIPQILDAATATSDSFLAPGRLTEVGGLVLAMGGSVPNTGLALYTLGMNVSLLARLGDDEIGDLTRRILSMRDPGLAEHLVICHEASSYTIVINPPGVDRTFLHCPGPNNTFGPEDVPPTLLAQARHFHFGYPPLMRRMFSDGGAELSTMFRQAKARGVTTSLDMAMPDPTRPSGRADWPAILRLTLPYVDMFLPSVEELLFMLRRERFDALRRAVGQARMLDAITTEEIGGLAEQALDMGCKIVALKLGHRGLYLRTARALAELGRGSPSDLAAWSDRELWAPCFKVHVVGTVGAGDSTIAGFITAVLKGQSPEEAVTSAVAVGACNVEAADATSGIRSWEETQARIKRPWERLDAQIHSPSWRRDSSCELWRGPAER